MDKKEIANNTGYRRRFYDRKKNKLEIEIEPEKDKEAENIIEKRTKTEANIPASHRYKTSQNREKDEEKVEKEEMI